MGEDSTLFSSYFFLFNLPNNDIFKNIQHINNHKFEKTAYEQDSIGNNRLTGYGVFIGVSCSLYRTCGIKGQMELIEKSLPSL